MKFRNSFILRTMFLATVLPFASGCCSGVEGEGVTEAACDVILRAECAIPASANDCYQTYIVRNQDCCGDEYAALMNCFAAAEWYCDGDAAVNDSCGGELEDLNACQGDHPLCPHPPTGRPISC